MKKYTKLAALVAALTVAVALLAACSDTQVVEETPPTTQTEPEEVVIPERTDIPADAVEIGGYMWVAQLPSDPHDGDILGYDTTYDEEDNQDFRPAPGYNDVDFGDVDGALHAVFGVDSKFVVFANFSRQEASQIVEHLLGFPMNVVPQGYDDATYVLVHEWGPGGGWDWYVTCTYGSYPGPHVKIAASAGPNFTPQFFMTSGLGSRNWQHKDAKSDETGVRTTVHYSSTEEEVYAESYVTILAETSLGDAVAYVHASHTDPWPLAELVAGQIY
jgi:hypothetical protein